MGYYINLSSINLDDFKLKLINGSLLPSRQILKEMAEVRFNFFKSANISNVSELQKLLKKKSSFLSLAQNNLFTEEYLAILLREINSIHPKPNNFSHFIGLSAETIIGLKKVGIINTLHLFDKVLNPKERKDLCEQTGIKEEIILELTKLTDLSRIKWVGAMFARALYETGFDTSEKVGNANYEDLYKKISALNRKRNLYKGNIGLNDMKLCVDAAKDIPLDIEY
jgi:hypothetical protein